MLSISPDILFECLIPRLTNKELGRFALGCRRLKNLVALEIINRSKVTIEGLQACALLYKKIELFLRGEKTPEMVIIEKVLRDINHTKYHSPFDFFPYLNFNFSSTENTTIYTENLGITSRAENLSQKRLLVEIAKELGSCTETAFENLKWQEKKEKFYAQFDCEKPLRLPCIALIKQLELKTSLVMSPEPYIYINIHRSMPTGVIACFSVIDEKLKKIKDGLVIFDNHGLSYYNSGGHRSITLFAEGSGPEPQITSPQFLEKQLLELQAGVTLLDELRLLEITLGCYDYFPRLHSYFIHLLAGAIRLPHLKELHCRFHHAITDDHIADVIAFIEKRLVVNHCSLGKLFIFCWDISSEQISHFVRQLNAIVHATKVQEKLKLSVQIQFSTFRNFTPESAAQFKNAAQLYSTDKIDVDITLRF